MARILGILVGRGRRYVYHHDIYSLKPSNLISLSLSLSPSIDHHVIVKFDSMCVCVCVKVLS